MPQTLADNVQAKIAEDGVAKVLQPHDVAQVLRLAAASIHQPFSA